jgi:hypothetical protein
MSIIGQETVLAHLFLKPGMFVIASIIAFLPPSVVSFELQFIGYQVVIDLVFLEFFTKPWN